MVLWRIMFFLVSRVRSKMATWATARVTSVRMTTVTINCNDNVTKLTPGSAG